MADVIIRFDAQTQRARQNIEQLERELQNLRQRLGETSASARQASSGVDAVGDQAQRTSGQVRTVNATFESLEARMNDSRRAALQLRDRMNALNAELAENKRALLTANDAQRTIIETRNRAIRVNQGLLRSEQQRNSAALAGLTQERRELRGLTSSFEDSTNKSLLFSAGLGRVTSGLLALDAGLVVAQQVAYFADNALRATDNINAVKRGLEIVYGSAQIAEERFRELNEVAKLPGLDPAPLARFDSIFTNLGSTAKENEIIFTGTAKAVTTFGGDVFEVNRVLFQLSQAFAKNKVDSQDLRPIIEQTSGTFLKTAQEVLGFTGGIEDLRAAFEASGKTLREFLMPVFVAFNEEFEGAPIDSYSNAMDNIGVAFNNFTAAVLDSTTPVGKFFGFITEFLENEGQLWEEMRTGGEAIKAVGDVSVVSAAQVAVLQKDLFRVNEALEDATARYEALEADGVNPNTASMQQLDRRIQQLTTTSENLSGKLDTAKASMAELLQPTQTANTEFRVLTEEIERVDTRFLMLRERGDVLSQAIRQLPPEISAVREGFDALAPTAERVAAIFDDLTVGIVDTAAEERALNLINTELHGGLTTTAVDLETLVRNANLVNPAISSAVDSMHGFIGVMEGVQTEFQSVEDISDMVTRSIRDQASAFDELRRSVDGVRESQSRLPGDPIGSDVFDRFDPSSPGYTRNAGFFDPRLSGDFTIGDNLRELGRNFGEFSEDFTLDINGIIRAMEGTADPFDVLSSSLASINPALGIFTTGIRLLGEQFRESERFRRDFEDVVRTEGLGGPRDVFSRGRGSGSGGDTDFVRNPELVPIRDFFAGSDVFTGDLQAFAQSAVSQSRVDLAGNVNISELLSRLDEIIDRRLTGLAAELDTAELNLDVARQTGSGVNEALQSVIDAQTTLYQFEIDAFNEQRRLTGTQIGNVEELNRILNRLNNQARIQLEPISNITRFTPVTEQGRTPGTRFNAATGQFEQIPSVGSEAGGVEGSTDPRAPVEPIDTDGISDALQTQIASRVANDALQAIRTAAEDANVTEARILTLWEESRPLLEDWYNELLQDAEAIENESERTEAVAALGSLPDFIANLQSQYVTPVINGIRSSAEALQTRTANRLANNALGAIRTAASDANVTESEILQLWTDAQPFLEDWYNELFEDAHAIENAAERTEAVDALGSLPDFIANLKAQYVTPVINGIRSSAETLQTRTANRLANDALGAIREASQDANVTEAEILQLWTDAQPSLETWYNELLQDANAIENEAERTEAVDALGSLPDFIANLKAQYVTPVVNGINASKEALQTRTANRLANDALGAIRTAAQDANVTEAEILSLWEAAQPFLEDWYNELLQDANAIENEAERTEAVDALGSLPDFIANLKAQYVTPVVNGINASKEALQTRTANRLANDALGAIRTAAQDANVTEAEILSLWEAAQPFLEDWYNELLQDANAIENEAERTEAVDALGSLPDFIANLKAQYVTPVVNGINASKEALQTRTANRLANDALGAIRTAANDANVTEAEILALWEAAQPFLEDWYNELLQDANAIENEAERTEAVDALGSLPDFIANLQHQYVTPVISRLRSAAKALETQRANEARARRYAAEALQTRTANRLANDALGAIREAAQDANVTEAEILALWESALPFLENWYQELLDDANAIESDAERTEAVDALGSLPDFIANLKAQYVTPVVNGINASKEALQTRTANRLANDALGAIRTAANDANVTEAEILSLWEAAQPFLEDWYNELLQDANAIENEAERTEAVAALGSLPDFIANLKSQYVTPVVNGINASKEALQTKTANRLANDALGAIRTAANDANVTESEILQLWTDAQPFLEDWYNELLEDANAIENEAERGEAVAALGSLPDFIANLKAQYVTPIISGIRSSTEALQTRTANRLANNAITAISEASSGVNTTVEAILSLWDEAVPLIEDWYQELLDDANAIENIAERTEALAALGTSEDFVARIRERIIDPFVNRSGQRRAQSRSNLAQNVIDRSRFLLSTATSQEEFDSERANLVRATNDYYDLELERINGLVASETELQNIREDNALARIESLRDIQNLSNQFEAEQQRREQAFADIGLGAARSREDLQTRSRRALEDTFIDDDGFGGLGIGQAGALQRRLSEAIQEYGADAFIRNLQTNVRELLGDYADTFFYRPSFSESDIAEFEQIALGQARGIQDLETETARQRVDLLNQIAQEEANNQWKFDIATIATNTAPLMDADAPVEPPEILMPVAAAPPAISGDSASSSSQSQSQRPMRVEVVGTVDVDANVQNPVAIEGTVPIRSAETIQVFVVNSAAPVSVGAIADAISAGITDGSITALPSE